MSSWNHPKGECHYHPCRRKKELYQCRYCQNWFCLEHRDAQLPAMPFRNAKEHLEYSRTGGHPCPEYFPIHERREELRKEAETSALDRLLRTPKPTAKYQVERLIQFTQKQNRVNNFVTIGAIIALLVLVAFAGYYLAVFKPSPVSTNFTNRASPVPSVEIKLLPPPFSISFINPTPSNETVLQQNWFYVNTSASKKLKSANILVDGKREELAGERNSWYLNKTGLKDGKHVYEIYGMDELGNWGISEKRSLIIDTIAPKITFAPTSPPDNEYRDDGEITISVLVEEANLDKTSFELYSSTGLIGIKNYSQTQEMIWSSLPEGVYKYRAIAFDLAGNSNATEMRTLTIVPRYQLRPVNVKLRYTVRGVTELVDFTVYSTLNDYLAGISRSYYCDPTCPTDSEIELRFLDEENQKKALDDLVELVRSQSNNQDDQARVAISLVQKIPYDWNKFATSSTTSERYPYQVIHDNSGICGEKSKLLAFLLRGLGFGVALLDYTTEQHQAVGIKCPVQYSLGGSGYCFIETSRPSIVTDSEAEYYVTTTTLSPLSSTPTITQISGGASFDSVSEEYNDASEFNSIRKMGQVVSEPVYYEWVRLAMKYGLELGK